MAKKNRSSDYWRRRETRQRRKNLKDQQEYDRRIESIYRESMDNIQKEIDSFYARYASAEGITIAEAKKRASKLDMEEYSRKAKRYVEERDFSKQANEEMRLYNMTMKVNRLELLKAKIGLELVDGFDKLEKFFGEKLTEKTIDEFKRQAGILGKTVTETEAAKRARVLVNASFHNAKWSDRIWMHQDLLKNELDKLLRTGLIQGRGSGELARQLRKVFGSSVNDSERLMRTEMARVQTAAQQESFERNGFEEYEYICCGLPDACEICRALDGKVFKVKDMMVGENAPPMHPNCHCSTAAHYSNRADFDAWLDAKEAGETSLGFDEWRNSASTSAGDKRFTGLAAKIGGGEVPVHEEPEHIRTITPDDKKAIEREIRVFAEKYRGAKEEHAIVITKEGKVYHCFGTDGSVYPDYDLGDELYGAHVTHNHPEMVTEYTFSNEDVALFQKYNLASLHGCDIKYDYKLGDKSIGLDDLPDDWQTPETFHHSRIINRCQELGIGYRRSSR